MALDDKLFDVALEQVVEYATTTCRANAVDLVGELIRTLAIAHPDKVFARIFPLAKQRITSELKAGASSIRTTTTSIPYPQDAALHWWIAILCGTLTGTHSSVSSVVGDFSQSQKQSGWLIRIAF
jgi:proteasome activator subunit 4